MNIIRKVENKIKIFKQIADAKHTLVKISKFLQSKGVYILYVELPIPSKINGLSDFEMERINSWCFDFNKYKEELSKLKLLYGENITKDYIMSIFDGGIVVEGEKRKVLLDFESEHQHIINGRRITIDQPSIYHNTIYTHGACTWRGTGVEDGQTIASYLQKEINMIYPNSYKVVNSAIGRGSSIHDDYQVILEQDYRPGDIVILGSHGAAINAIPASFYQKLGIVYIETSSAFNRPHNYGEWFNDSTLHTNYRGNKVLANCIYNSLVVNKWIKNDKTVSLKKETPEITNELMTGSKIYGDNPELIKFIKSLKPYKEKNKNAICGCIVMNCNPFTLGHRYLIEYAASKVDRLYIFVVEENKSYFNFDDRFRLVKEGTSHINNVTVLPSGHFIISAATFPGYFYKDNLKEAKIDCSNDLNVFAQYIAPALNITIRFAGEEPLDPITNQYNEAMTEILPKYGIKFHAIPRKTESNEVISASRVRKYYESGNLEAIKNIVPETTYRYLSERYQRERHDSNQK